MIIEPMDDHSRRFGPIGIDQVHEVLACTLCGAVMGTRTRRRIQKALPSRLQIKGTNDSYARILEARFQ